MALWLGRAPIGPTMIGVVYPCRSNHHARRSLQTMNRLPGDMKSVKRDIVIHYDEDQGKVIFYSAVVELTAAIRADAFDGVSPTVDEMRKGTPEEAEQRLGRLVFSLLDLGAIKRIGVRDYEAEANEMHAEWVEELETKAISDSEAQFFLSMELHRKAMTEGSAELLARADLLLRQAADAGYADAKAKLAETWPDLHEIAVRRIRRMLSD